MSDPTVSANAEPLTYWVWLTPLLFVVGGIVIGQLVERLVIARLRAWAATTAWQGDDLILDGLKGLALIWCVLIGLYGATHTSSLSPESIQLLKNIIKVGWIISFTIALARITSGLVQMSTQSLGGAFANSTIVINLVRVLIVVTGVLVALESVGISITPILTALGVGGLAVALALQEPLSNLFAGLQILAAKRVRLGDYVKLDSGDEGHVTDIAWRNTTLTTLANNTVVVPNAKLGSSIVTNYHLPDTPLVFTVPVGVAYGSDLTRVERIAVEVAREVMTSIESAAGLPDPVIRFTAFADSAITFNVVMRARVFADQFLMRHELIKRLQTRFMAEGIEIPYPIRTVIVKGQAPTLPITTP